MEILCHMSFLFGKQITYYLYFFLISARIRLIFTRRCERSQLRQQINQPVGIYAILMPHLLCKWVSGQRFWEQWPQAVRWWAFCCIPLALHIISLLLLLLLMLLLSLCYSVTMPLSQPMRFCFFLPVLLHRITETITETSALEEILRMTKCNL